MRRKSPVWLNCLHVGFFLRLLCILGFYLQYKAHVSFAEFRSYSKSTKEYLEKKKFVTDLNPAWNTVASLKRAVHECEPQWSEAELQTAVRVNSSTKTCEAVFVYLLLFRDWTIENEAAYRCMWWCAQWSLLPRSGWWVSGGPGRIQVWWVQLSCRSRAPPSGWFPPWESLAPTSETDPSETKRGIVKLIQITHSFRLTRQISLNSAQRAKCSFGFFNWQQQQEHSAC